MNTQGISNTILNPKKPILWRDPSSIIINRDLYREPAPNFKPSQLTNGSVFSDRFNVVTSTRLIPINATVVDPKFIIKNETNKFITPPLNVKVVNFLKLNHSISTSKENAVISTKPDFNAYMKIIAYIKGKIITFLTVDEKEVLKEAMHTLQNKYIQNKDHLTESIITSMINEYYTRVKPVYTRYYESSNKMFNPMNIFEMGISDITPFIDMNNDEIVQPAQPIVQPDQPLVELEDQEYAVLEPEEEIEDEEDEEDEDE